MPQSRRPTDRRLVPVLVALVAVAMIVFVVVRSSSEPSAEEGGVAGPFSDQERRSAGDLLALGPIDAPVGLVVFSDYQCPFCARWSVETLPAMVDLAKAGTLRIEWRDANVFGEASEAASRAAYAAARQDRFWDYHDALFEDGTARSDSELSESALVDLATRLGLDGQRFQQDLVSEETRLEIERNAAQAASIGAHSTPTFILNGHPIVGAQPTSVFVDAVATMQASQGG